MNITPFNELCKPAELPVLDIYLQYVFHFSRLLLALFTEMIFIGGLWTLAYFVVLRKFNTIKEIVGV